MNSQLEHAWVSIAAELLQRLSGTVRERLPRKSFGYLLSTTGATVANDFAMFEDNVRNCSDWKGHFQSYGQYFVEHDDAGFVATCEESWQVQQEIWAKHAVEVGMFHSHLRHPANFSAIDYDMHVERFQNLWHLIVSMRNPEQPQLRVFAVSRNNVREMIYCPPIPDAAEQTHLPFDWQYGIGANSTGCAKDAVMSEARDSLSLARDGTPRCKDNEAIVRSLGALLSTCDVDAIDQFVTRGFLRSSAARYSEFVAPRMRELAGGAFQMGSDAPDRRHFVGEVPRRSVSLTPFAVAETSVTLSLYKLFDRSLPVDSNNANQPVTGVTWFDAMVFSMWMGCRLPSEAEWEFACNCGAQGEWTCRDERALTGFGWFSENSNGALRNVGLLEPNAYGLYDLHGNVWEWCFDCYDEHYYAQAPATDPVCLTSPVGRRSCRGGSVHALAEMCRTRYRFSEPATFKANDLGFRLARSLAAA